MCMEAMLGISLYSCLYLKVAKTLCLLFNKIREQEGGTGYARMQCGTGGPKNIYTCMCE
jgi:hypothetical protein